MDIGIIYDLDDLMVDSHPLHEKANELLFNEYGHSFEELPVAMRTKFVGRRIIDIFVEVVEYFKLEIDIEFLYQKRNEIFLAMVKKDLKAMPGLHKSLEIFNKHKFKIALASSGTKTYIDVVLDKFRIRKYFDVIISGDDVKEGKPNPEVYIMTAKKLSIAPDNCVVLEDAKAGVDSAKSAGCKCIAIQSPSTPPQDLRKADLYLNSLINLTPKIIENLLAK
ncbi:MAG: HAD family phosphatase [Patescibacteria group bacterium]|nr:HAD family phosphatase [Patescibacteria group bacterium]